jgi:hypothetical protein
MPGTGRAAAAAHGNTREEAAAAITVAMARASGSAEDRTPEEGNHYDTCQSQCQHVSNRPEVDRTKSRQPVKAAGVNASAVDATPPSQTAATLRRDKAAGLTAYRSSTRATRLAVLQYGPRLGARCHLLRLEDCRFSLCSLVCRFYVPTDGPAARPIRYACALPRPGAAFVINLQRRGLPLPGCWRCTAEVRPSPRLRDSRKTLSDGRQCESDV